MSIRRHCFSILAVFALSIFLGSCSGYRKPVSQPPGIPSPPPPEKQAVADVQKEEKPPVQEEEKKEENQETPPAEESTAEEEEDPSILLEVAMANYQDAQDAWEKGDFDTAIAALDDAYGILLKVNIPPESPLIQDKNDLRLLIARRIQEIHASRRIAISNNHKTIPLTENKFVLEEIKNFQTKERKYFEESYKKSGRYREAILKELEKAGLPEQLFWMPMIESWFKVNAYSKARALGLWQFIASTGYRFGLKRDRWIDERMDPVKATQAAAQYLSELHSFFGDWTTALAAYNCGEFRVQRVIQNQRINYLDNFWDLFVMLPRETARFVPRFIATLLIINNPENYGFNLPTPDPPQRYETITINRPIQLSALAEISKLDTEILTDLNPELRYGSTPEREYLLRVPEGYGEKVLASINSVPSWIPPEATYVIHYVRRGETVSGIASRYGTSISAIGRLNGLRRNYLIRPGQRLRVPSRGGEYLASSSSLTLSKDGAKLVYTVKRGDSLYLIAKTFNTTVKDIRILNDLKGDLLYVGQKLTIQSEVPEGAMEYTVRAGDIPYDIAKKFKMDLGFFLRINNLTIRSKIYPNQKLWVIPPKN